MDKQELYDSIIKTVAKEVKKALNESEQINEGKLGDWFNKEMSKFSSMPVNEFKYKISLPLTVCLIKISEHNRSIYHMLKSIDNDMDIKTIAKDIMSNNSEYPLFTSANKGASIRFNTLQYGDFLKSLGLTRELIYMGIPIEDKKVNEHHVYDLLAAMKQVIAKADKLCADAADLSNRKNNAAEEWDKFVKQHMEDPYADKDDGYAFIKAQAKKYHQPRYIFQAKDEQNNTRNFWFIGKKGAIEGMKTVEGHGWKILNKEPKRMD